MAGALFIALTANFAVPVPGSPVPLTGQTFSVLLVGGALGMRRGVLATGLYLVLGFFLPVYAEHAHGVRNDPLAAITASLSWARPVATCSGS